jgi:hypothetical protein
MPVKRKRLPQIVWREVDPLAHGSKQWESKCGLFKYQCIDRYDDIPMKPVYNLYVFRGGEWKRVLDSYRSYTGMMKYARALKQTIEDHEDDE